MEVVKARNENVDSINQIIRESKSYWKYSEAYLNAAMPLILVNEAYLKDNRSFEIYEKNQIVGFFSITDNREEKYLDNLWIDPNFIGKGFGRIAIHYVEKIMREEGWESIYVLPDPPAERFYFKMGFLDTGKRVESRVEEGPTFSLLKRGLNSTFWATI